MNNQFDVYPNPAKKGREARPFVVDVQSNRFRDLQTRVVIPLIVATDINEVPRLMPKFLVDGTQLYLQPLEIAVLPTRLLRNAVTNFEPERFRIIAAIDLVFTGV